MKAAFLFNFAKFTEWPSGEVTNRHSPFVMCVLGKDPFGSVLDDTLQGKTLREQRVVVQRLQDASGARQCHVVFVSRSEAGNLAAIFQALRGTNALVVGETDGFAESGGAIELTLDQGRVRFTINPGAAQRAGLRLSSKLLALAKIVRDKPADGKS